MEERTEEISYEGKRAKPIVVAYILGVFGTIFISTIATMGAKNQDKTRVNYSGNSPYTNISAVVNSETNSLKTNSLDLIVESANPIK